MDSKKVSNLRPHVLRRIEKALSDISYKDAIENSAKYNNRLVVDRKTRLPFIDSQTGVAQRDCYLWMQRWQRMPGTNYGQLYTYPAHKWRKRRRGYLFRENYFSRNQVNENSGEIHQQESGTGSGGKGNGFEVTTNKNDVTNLTNTIPGASTTTTSATSVSESNQNSSDKYVENSKDAWMYAEYEDSMDLMEEDFEDPTSDGDDYDEYSSRRKKRRSRRKKGEVDNDKPYACDLCDARYKTRPGLTYHYSHNHQNDGEKRSKSSTPVSMVDEDSRASTRNNSSATNQSGNGSSNKDSRDKPLAPPNPYCDFCLEENEKNSTSNKSQEKMVSCSDCGRSAHPSCLQFTPQMIISVAKYRWQCIECKSCGICGTSDNDEQLLFCDDCDRGYHMYCLTPPISEPPEGSWSCHLCIEQYHKPKESKDSSGKEAEKTIDKEKEKTDEIDNKLSAKAEVNGKETSTTVSKEEKLPILVKENDNLEKAKTVDSDAKPLDKKPTQSEEKIDKKPPIIEERLKSLLEGTTKRENEPK